MDPRVICEWLGLDFEGNREIRLGYQSISAEVKRWRPCYAAMSPDQVSLPSLAVAELWNEIEVCEGFGNRNVRRHKWYEFRLEDGFALAWNVDRVLNEKAVMKLPLLPLNFDDKCVVSCLWMIKNVWVCSWMWLVTGKELWEVTDSAEF